eukprot:COSAG01_NODE_2618_length_7371_cov_13.342959_4_plen_121_part_00
MVPAPPHAYKAGPLSAYRPALQLEHAATFDTVEYFPAAHIVQLLALVPVPVLVSEPAAQAMHDAVVPAPPHAYEAAGHAPLHAAAVPAAWHALQQRAVVAAVHHVAAAAGIAAAAAVRIE